MQPTNLLPGEAAHFWEAVEKTSTCWLWRGTLTGGGYGTFRLSRLGRDFRAHRISFVLFGNEIPDGLVLDHICRVRNCVNPDHLRAVTDAENVLAGIGPTAVNARKTHCPRGHEYTPENIYRRKDGARRCLTCLTTKLACPECGEGITYRNLAMHRRRKHDVQF